LQCKKITDKFCCFVFGSSRQDRPAAMRRYGRRPYRSHKQLYCRANSVDNINPTPKTASLSAVR